jgi:hypothetical protein
MKVSWRRRPIFIATLLLCSPSAAIAQVPAIAGTPIETSAVQTDDAFSGKYLMTILDAKADKAEPHKYVWELQLHQDQTYYLRAQEFQYGGVYNTEYGRGVWARDGNIITLKDSTKNSKEPMFTLGLSLRWSKTAHQHAAYYKAQIGYADAWKAVTARCPFWTANGNSYGISAAISADQSMSKRPFDESAILAVKKLADSQVDDALDQFFRSTPGTAQWTAASQNVDDAYTRQNNAYASMAETLQSAGRDQYELVRNVPKQCGAPQSEEPGADDFISAANENPENAEANYLPNADMPKGQVGVMIHDPNYETKLRGANVTAALNDKSMLKAETDETGWAFFTLPTGKTIISLTAELERDENGPDLKTVLPVSIEQTQVQDIWFDQLRVQQPIFPSLLLRIDGKDLVMTIEDITGRLVRDTAGEYAE